MSRGFDERIWGLIEVRKVFGFLGHDGRRVLQAEGRHESDSLRDREGQGFIQLCLRDYPLWAMDRRDQALEDPGALHQD